MVVPQRPGCPSVSRASGLVFAFLTVYCARYRNYNQKEIRRNHRSQRYVKSDIHAFSPQNTN